MAFQFVRELTKDWEEMEAYDLGIIDADGKILKKQKDLQSSEEKAAYTFFHRLIWNLKRLLDKTPGGKSKIKNYAAAMALLKENEDLIRQHFKRSFFGDEYNQALTLYEETVNVTSGVAKIDMPLFGKKKKKKKDDDEEEEQMSDIKTLKAKLKEAEESLDEARKLKKVVRGGKMRKKMECPEGQQFKDGKCVPIKSSDKLRFVKAAKKRKRALAGKSTAKATRKRNKSQRKRSSMGLS
jgi:hypothetical protein